MKSWIKTLSWSVALAIAFTTTTLAQIASDNAGNYPDNSWTNGSNGGTGFGAWVLTADAGTGSAGFFTGDPASASIAGMDTVSFGLYANPSDSGAYVNADRTFTGLQVGDAFSFQWGINFDSGASGNKGFNLYSGEFTTNQVQILNVNNAGTSDITLNGENIGFGYGANVMTWSFSLVSSNLLRITANDRDGDGSLERFIPVTAAPDAFRLYASNLQAGDSAQPYFNDFLIETGAPPATITNTVTFSVDMSVQIAAGNFDASTNNVEVRGDFNGFSGGITLTQVVGTVYSATLDIEGFEGQSIGYKFYGLPETTGLGYETRENRSFALGADGTATNLPVVFFDDIEAVPVSPAVTFSVDMSVQAQLGNFNPGTDGLEVRGSFNGFSGGNVLTLSSNNIYVGTVVITGAPSAEISYKFYVTPEGGTLDWENDPNRTFNLGENSDPIVLEKVFFNNVTEVPLTVDVTFSVDMSVQIDLGNFNTETNGVEVRGDFNSFSGGSALTNAGNGIYTGTFQVSAGAGSTIEYKFFGTPDPGGLTWESIGNRSFTLGTDETPISLDTVYFNDQGPVASAPAITDFTFVAGVPTATIDSETNNNYTLVYTTNLLSITSVTPPVLGEWVAGATITGTGSPVVLTDTNELIDASRVYGVLIQPAD